MSVHITPLSNKNLNLVLRIYTNDADYNEAYKQRKSFPAVCLVSIKPSSDAAWVHCMHGKITTNDYGDILERLYVSHGIVKVQYERAAGYFITLKRRSYRRWMMKRQDMPKLEQDY